MFLFKEEGILNYSGKVLANQFRTQISKEMADFDKTAERWRGRWGTHTPKSCDYIKRQHLYTLQWLQ